MRIFITGASGFIGGAIAEAMTAEHEVLAMSRSDKIEKDLGYQPVVSVALGLRKLKELKAAR